VEALVNGLFDDVYRGRRVLVTGHTGFKGSWLCLWLRELGADVTALALPADTAPSHWSLLGLDDVAAIEADVRDADAVERVVAGSRPEIVFHLAAQSLVRRGYRHPRDTFATNVGGLVNLLESVRRCDSVRAVVSVTTDKVYREPAPSASGYREDDPLGGHDPYSASKACAEIVTECYRGSFLAAAGCGVATARAGNVIGGGDWAEDRLVPDLVRAAAAGDVLRLRHPEAIRPWQHVLEPLSGYLVLGQSLLAGGAVDGAWNFGPSADATLTVGELAERLRVAWPGLAIAASPGPHPREAARLTLDSTRARERLGWAPVWDAERTIERTAGWYAAYHRDGRVESRDDLAAYVDDARRAGARWAA
jgi:CDP-glucose 4,6-dehydratase